MSYVEPDDDVISSVVDTTVPYVPGYDIILSSVATDNDSNTVPYIVAMSPIMISDDSMGEVLFEPEENLANLQYTNVRRECEACRLA